MVGHAEGRKEEEEYARQRIEEWHGRGFST
jgi:hypothetical protein